MDFFSKFEKIKAIKFYKNTDILKEKKLLKL